MLKQLYEEYVAHFFFGKGGGGLRFFTTFKGGAKILRNFRRGGGVYDLYERKSEILRPQHMLLTGPLVCIWR